MNPIAIFFFLSLTFIRDAASYLSGLIANIHSYAPVTRGLLLSLEHQNHYSPRAFTHAFLGFLCICWALLCPIHADSFWGSWEFTSSAGLFLTILLEQVSYSLSHQPAASCSPCPILSLGRKSMAYPLHFKQISCLLPRPAHFPLLQSAILVDAAWMYNTDFCWPQAIQEIQLKNHFPSIWDAILFLF